MGRAFENFIFLLAVSFLWVVFGGVGFWMAFIQAPEKRNEAVRIEALPGETPQQFSDLGDGTEVAVTATLEGNPMVGAGISSIFTNFASYQLVAFQREEWTVHAKGNRVTGGSWFLPLQDIPGLSARFGDRLITTLRVPYGEVISFTGNLHEFIQENPNDFRSYEYKGRKLGSGSLRALGLQNGDVVTIVGTLTPNGIAPIYLHAGDKANLVALLSDEAEKKRVYGILWMGISTLIALVVLLAKFRGKRKKT